MEFLIPVAFDVTAPDEQTAARIVAETIGRGGLLDTIRDASCREGGDQMIESWWFPEAVHKHIDGNDNAAMTLVHHDYTEPGRHRFIGPSPGLVDDGADPDECGECGQSRTAHDR